MFQKLFSIINIALKIFAVIFVFAGIGLLYWGYKDATQLQTALKNAAYAQGTIIALDIRGGRRGVSHAPIIEFSVNDQKHQFIWKFYTNLGYVGYHVGDRVPVVYNVSDPNIAYVDTFMGKYLIEAVEILIGLGFCGAAVHLMYGIKNSPLNPAYLNQFFKKP